MVEGAFEQILVPRPHRVELPAVVIDSTHVEFAHYLTAMQLAGEYAYAGRDIVTGQVLEILGAEALDEIHNHHNFPAGVKVARMEGRW